MINGFKDFLARHVWGEDGEGVVEGTLPDGSANSMNSTLASQPLPLGSTPNAQPADVMGHLSPPGTLPGSVTSPVPAPIPVPVPVPGAVPDAVPIPAPSAPPVEDSPTKRRPGRPKGSGKKAIDLSTEPKVKRPVGRPRKDGLPAGSVGPKKPGRPRKRAPGSFATQTNMPLTYPPPPFMDPSQWASISAPPAVRAPPHPTFPIDPSLDNDNWAELARHRPDQFLHALVSALSAPNPVSAAGVTVEDAFRAHLASLTPNPKTPNQSTIPALYSILKTFWLPSSPAYFSLTASASTSRSTPSEYRFLYWDPQPLVFNGIACPACASALMNKGHIASGPIKIYDLGKPFFVIGCEYVCKSPICLPPGTQGEGRRFASTDSAIMRALPAKLKDEFPARLIQGAGNTPDMGPGPDVWNWRGMGVSTTLWDMVGASLRAGIYKDVILGVIHSVVQGLPDEPWAIPPGMLSAGKHEEEEEEGDGADAVGESVSANGGTNEDGTQDMVVDDPAKEGQTAEAFQEAWTNHNGAPQAPTNGMPEPGPSTQNGTHQVPMHPPPPPPEFASPFAPPYMSYSYPPAGFYPPPGHPPPPPPPNMMKRTFALVEGSDEPVPRRVRHCVKCGSNECKGKGGRSFCTNPCQDCGKMDCKGRNSKRPDRTCADAWSPAENAAAAAAAAAAATTTTTTS